eukprot:gene11253-12553_t
MTAARPDTIMSTVSHVPNSHPLTKNHLLTREVVRRAMAKGMLEESLGQQLVEAWVTVEMNTKGFDDEQRARLYERLILKRFGLRGRRWVRLIFQGRQTLQEEVKLKLIDQQLVRQLHYLDHCRRVIDQKRTENEESFTALLKEDDCDNYGSQNNNSEVGEGGLVGNSHVREKRLKEEEEEEEAKH